jgi:hypothetical protein
MANKRPVIFFYWEGLGGYSKFSILFQGSTFEKENKFETPLTLSNNII